MTKIAFIGATRGCALETLVRVLQDEAEGTTECYVLSRRPEEFSKHLLEERKIDPKAYPNLTIIAGDALVEESLFSFLSTAAGSQTLDQIVFSLGGKPVFNRGFLKAPGLEPANVCERGARNLFAALKKLALSKQPRLITVSSSGIGDFGHSIVPFGLKQLCE